MVGITFFNITLMLHAVRWW